MEFTCLHRASLCCVLSLASSSAAFAAPGFFFTKNSLMSEKNYAQYIHEAHELGAPVKIFTVDFNPMTADHLRDFNDMQRELREFSETSRDGVILFGYSATSKFVAKLALEEANIRGLFVMDPVDGTPPFMSQRNFPVFLEPAMVIKVPTWIVQSEYGSVPASMGPACVPKDYGADFFAAHVEPQMLRHEKITGSDHTDFLNPPISMILEKPCKPGTATSASVLNTTLSLFRDFLGAQVNGYR